MRITIEIDGTTFTAEPAQRDARASGVGRSEEKVTFRDF